MVVVMVGFFTILFVGLLVFVARRIIKRLKEFGMNVIGVRA